MSKRKIIENDFDFNNFSKKKKDNNNNLGIFTKITFIILGILMAVSFFTPTTYGDLIAKTSLGNTRQQMYKESGAYKNSLYKNIVNKIIVKK